MSSSYAIASSLIGGKIEKFSWQYQNQTFTIISETLGQGLPVLLLPAFSTVSSRTEMQGIARGLSSDFQVTALDWLGFGESERPSVNYCPELYHQLLLDFVAEKFDRPVAVVAAGHAAGYAMKLAQQKPNVWSKIVLVAPTWRGPLPTMGANPTLANTVKNVVQSPFLGQFLYKLNTAPSFLKWMYSRHVYADAAKLTDTFIQTKWQITQQPGARFAPAAFVTGNLDPVRSRQDFLQTFQPLPAPTLVILAENAPPKSKAEMEAVTQIPAIQTHTLPGTLGLHEEFASQVVDIIQPFLLE